MERFSDRELLLAILILSGFAVLLGMVASMYYEDGFQEGLYVAAASRRVPVMDIRSDTERDGI